MTAHTNLKRADEKYPQSHTQPAVGSLRWGRYGGLTCASMIFCLESTTACMSE